MTMSKKPKGSGDPLAITFTAELDKAWSTPDGGWKLTLATGQEHGTEIIQAVTLRGYLLQVAILPVQPEDT